MNIQVEEVSLNIRYPPPSPPSSLCSDRSTPSPDSGLECPPSQLSDSNFLTLKTGNHVARRKISTSSEASCESVNFSYDGGFSEEQLTPDDITSPSSNKYDDIIEKIDGLKFSPSSSTSYLNEPEITVKLVDQKIIRDDEDVDEDGEEDDDDLQERGPDLKGKQQQRRKPYEMVDGWPILSAMPTMPELESKAQEILSDKEYGHLMKNCIDQLYHGEQGTSSSNEWVNVNEDNSHLNEAPIPSIILTENSLFNEEQLINLIGQQKFQAAQLDTSHNQHPSPAASASDNWPDSPASSGNNVQSSRSHSRGSSRAQSPGSLPNLGSPLIPVSVVGSPPQQRLTQFRQPRPQSSSSSSNYSYGDTPSPSNYLHSIDPQCEDHLGAQFCNFGTYCNFESSSTIINSTDNFDDFRLQLVNETIRDNLKNDEMQVVPKFHSNPMCDKANDKYDQNLLDQDYLKNMSNLSNTGTLINSAQNNLLYNNCYYGLSQNFPNSMQESSTNEPCLTSSEGLVDFDSELAEILGYSSQKTTPSQIYPDKTPHIYSHNNNDDMQQKSIAAHASTTQVHYELQNQYSNFDQTSPSTSDGFMIPKPVSQYRSSTSRRNSLKKTSPWASLNLPTIPASETLRAHVDPKEVERAMKSLLKKSNQELTKVDEDGDTMLMCLVGNPLELEMKKAYLVPLVERLGQIPDGLSKMNNRGEDALYLAAMNAPQMPYVAGYLAAAMLQKGIDISQRLYHTRGDTLIHAIAMRGETHKSVLAQLLLLKTLQGNSVFDLSQCNYDGRTPLHVAVESHSPLALSNNSTSIVKLLLENGADPKVKETERGNTALHLAVSLSSDPNLIRALLIKRGCEAVNISNRDNDTPLRMATAISERVGQDIQAEICDSLIKAGATPNISEI